MLILACVSPAESDCRDTLLTLQYAVGAKEMKTKLTVEEAQPAGNQLLSDNICYRCLEKEAAEVGMGRGNEDAGRQQLLDENQSLRKQLESALEELALYKKNCKLNKNVIKF